MTKLHVRFGMILALLLVVSGTANMTVAAPSAPATEATWTPIVMLPVGSGDGQIGYRFKVEGAGNLGPQALAAGPDGTIYVRNVLPTTAAPAMCWGRGDVVLR
jgi:hypothetical protein